MGPLLPQNPAYKNQGPLPPAEKHFFKDIGSNAMNLFGMKKKWQKSTQFEKNCLIIAAAIIAIALLIFSFLSMFQGFMAAFQMLPTLLPMAFGATWPMFLYARSQLKRAPETAKQIEANKKREEALREENEKADKLYRQKMGKDLLTSSFRSYISSDPSASTYSE